MLTGPSCFYGFAFGYTLNKALANSQVRGTSHKLYGAAPYYRQTTLPFLYDQHVIHSVLRSFYNPHNSFSVSSADLLSFFFHDTFSHSEFVVRGSEIFLAGECHRQIYRSVVSFRLPFVFVLPRIRLCSPWCLGALAVKRDLFQRNLDLFPVDTGKKFRIFRFQSLR